MNRNHSIPYRSLFFAAVLSGVSVPALAQPLYTYAPLPVPPDTAASEPLGISYHETGAAGPKRYMIGGRTIDTGGVSRAVVWTQAADGTWSVQLLPVTDPNADSEDWHVDSFFDVTVDLYRDSSVGSTGNTATPGGQQPAAWTCSGDPCTWTAETVNLPSGYTGGAAKRVAHFASASTLTRKACGVATDSTGGTKAVVWTRDGAALTWVPMLLPGLVDPDPGSVANGMAAPCSDCGPDGTQISWAIVGAAMNSGGQQVPVRWSCDPAVNDCMQTASWTVTALPLLSGGMQGEAVAMDRAQTIEVIASNQDVGGGGTTVKRGSVYICDPGPADDCTLPSSWTVVEVPPLPGYANSQAFGIKEDGVNIVADGSSDNGAGTEVATDWIVDRSVSPPTVSVFDVNNLVVNLPSNIALKKKGDIKDSEIIVILDNRDIQARSAAAFVGGAAVLTELPASIPAVTSWGLVVMALLMLVAGTIVYCRRGHQEWT